MRGPCGARQDPGVERAGLGYQGRRLRATLPGGVGVGRAHRRARPLLSCSLPSRELLTASADVGPPPRSPAVGPCPMPRAGLSCSPGELWGAGRGRGGRDRQFFPQWEKHHSLALWMVPPWPRGPPASRVQPLTEMPATRERGVLGGGGLQPLGSLNSVFPTQPPPGCCQRAQPWPHTQGPPPPGACRPRLGPWVKGFHVIPAPHRGCVSSSPSFRPISVVSCWAGPAMPLGQCQSCSPAPFTCFPAGP